MRFSYFARNYYKQISLVISGFILVQSQHAYNFVPPPLRGSHPIENELDGRFTINVGRGVASGTRQMRTRPAIPYNNLFDKKYHGSYNIPGQPGTLPTDFTNHRLPVRVFPFRAYGEPLAEASNGSQSLVPLDTDPFLMHPIPRAEPLPQPEPNSKEVAVRGSKTLVLYGAPLFGVKNSSSNKKKLPMAEPLPDSPETNFSLRTKSHLMHDPKQNKAKAFANPTADKDDEYYDEKKEDEGTVEEAAVKLPDCYRTAGGFLCCNKILEELMYASIKHVEKKNLSKCNVHALVDSLQERAQDFFQTTFEIIVGTGDFASKTRFRDDLICKTIIKNKIVLIYATPEPYSLTETNKPLTH